MYGENGALVKRISGQLPVLAMHTDTIYLFPSSFDVPEYGVKVTGDDPGQGPLCIPHPHVWEGNMYQPW